MIPDSALTPSTTYYTSTIGQALGPVVLTTGGGNAAGVGDPSGRNDDGFSGPINLGFNLTFFGQTYSSFYINNNGNVSFGNGIAAYVPTGPQGASQPVISPWFDDVDTRSAASGVVHLLQLANEDIITWDAVGYYDDHADTMDSFQLVLRGPGFVLPTGQGNIGFWYTTMGWEATDISHMAAIGFGDGASNGEVLQGSLSPGLNGIVQDSHIWFIGINPVPPTPMPEPDTVLVLTVALLGVAATRLRRQG